jgi:hypothetical protein
VFTGLSAASIFYCKTTAKIAGGAECIGLMVPRPVFCGIPGADGYLTAFRGLGEQQIPAGGQARVV